MKTTTIFVMLILVALIPALPAGAQCGERSAEWGFGPTRGADGNGEVAVFSAGRGLRVADISDPGTPAILAELTLPDFLRGVTVAGNYAYVAQSNAGLAIVNISNPAAPEVVGTYDADNSVYEVAVVDSTAYVAASTSGIVILDVTDPTAPTEISTCDYGGGVRDLVVRDDMVYAASYSAGLQIIDISNPAEPSLVSSLESAGDGTGIAFTDDGSTVFITDFREGLRVIDVSNPLAPVEIAFVDEYSYALDVAVEGSFAYFANRGYGMRIYDISDPAAPVEVRRVIAGAIPQRIRIHDGVAYLADETSGMSLVDISSPADAEVISTVPGFPWLYGVSTWGATTFLAGGNTILTFDVSDPASPSLSGMIDPTRHTSKAVASEGYLYVATDGDGLMVHDLDDPSKPISTEVPEGGDFNDVAVVGDFAYAVGSWDDLTVIDISEPSDPEVVATVPSATGPYLAVSGDLLFLPQPRTGVHIVDISNPGAPAEIALIENEDVYHRPAVYDQILYVPLGGPGIGVYDISVPTEPVEVNLMTQPGYAFGVATVGQLLFVADIYNGAFVYDVADPSEPVLLTNTDLAVTTEGDIGIDGPRVTVTESKAGFEIFDLGPCFDEAPTADFSWSPHTPESGRSAALVDLSIGSVVTRHWDFGDDSQSTEAFPAHIWSAPGDYDVTLTVSGPHGNDSVTKTVTVIELAGGDRLISDPGVYSWVIAASAHAPGLEGTSWVTDVVLHNPEAGSTTAYLWFMKSNQPNIGAVGLEMEVAAETSVQINDVVSSMFGENESSGAVLIGADSPLLITSRTYNDAASGTFGQFIPAREVGNAFDDTDTVELIQLTRSDDFRTNIGAANPTGQTVTVDVSLRNASGAEVKSQSFSVPAYGHRQVTDIFGQDLNDGFAVVSSPTPGASYFPYASVVDNRTGDPIFIEPIADRTVAIVAATAHVGGLEDTDWRTDLEVCNPESTTAMVEIDLLATGQNNSDPATHEQMVDAGACLRLDDVLDSVFGFSGTGALDVHGDQASVMISSRTFNTTDAGTFGQFLPGLDPTSTIDLGTPGRLIQLAQDAGDDSGFRTNIGFVNRAATSTEVRTDLYSPAGKLLGSVTTTLRPFGHQQVNRIFRQVTTDTVDNGYAVVESSASGHPIIAYASVIDNASGDPIYIPAMQLEP